MKYDSLGDRMKGYEQVFDARFTRRMPVMVRLDGRSFTRLTRKLRKPYEPLLSEAMAHTMLYLASDIQGAVFGFQQSDEITLILKNDQDLDSEPWYDNRIQKITSVSASIATLAFNRFVDALEVSLDLVGDATFDARAWIMPSVAEVVNNIIWRQQDCRNNAINSASLHLLGQKHGRKTAMNILNKKSTQTRLEIIQDECGIDFDQEYPSLFRWGIGCYKVPTLINTKDGPTPRNKWRINWELPDFRNEGRDFLYNLILSGKDVIRAESLIKI